MSNILYENYFPFVISKFAGKFNTKDVIFKIDYFWKTPLPGASHLSALAFCENTQLVPPSIDILRHVHKWERDRAGPFLLNDWLVSKSKGSSEAMVFDCAPTTTTSGSVVY